MREYNILHIEDSLTDADIIRRGLEKSGMQFRYFLADNEQAVKKGLDDFKPDLILCDHSLPNFNSKMAFVLCKEDNPDLPFILVTGTVSEEFAVDMLKTGIDDYLLKSNLRRLPAAISNTFERRENDKKIRKIQTDLQQSEAHLRTIFENSTVGLILLDKDAVILELNDRAKYYNTLSFGRELLQNENLLLAVPEYRKKELSENFSRVLQGEKMNFESAYPQQDGSFFIFAVSLNPTISTTGEVTGACLTFEDITERKKNEQIIKESEVLNRSILNSIRSHIAVVDENGYIVEVNRAWNDFSISNGETLLEKTGKGSNYVTACNMAVKAGDVLAAEALQGFQQVLKKEIPFFEMEYPCHSKAEERWFLLRIVNFEDNSPKVVMMHIDISEIKKTEEERRSLTNRLLLATTSAGMGMWHWDLKNDHLFWDEALYQLYKINSGHLGSVYEGWLARVHPDDKDRVNAVIQMAITDKKKKFDSEFRIIWDDLSVHYLKGTGIIEYDDEGNIKQLVGINWDITKEKETEKALITSEKEFRSLAESMPQIVWTTRADGWNTYFNQNWRDYTGLTVEESSGHGWNKPFHPDDQQRAWDAWQNAVQNVADYSLECRLRKHDGMYQWWLVRGIPQLGDNGEILKWYGTCTDIEQIKQSEEIIKKEKVLSDSVINSLPGIFYLFDETGKFLRWNKQFELISGYSAEEIANMHPVEFFRDDEIQLITERIGEVFSNGKSTAEAHLVTKDNRKIPFYFTGTLISYDEKSCVVGVGVDITERKNAERGMESLANRLQLATTSAGMGIWDWDIKNDHLLWDEGMYRLYKIDNSHFGSVYEEWLSRLHPEDIGRVNEEIQLGIAGTKKYNTEFRIIWSDQSVHYIKAMGITESDNKGNVVRMIGLNWDITPQIEEEIRIAKAIIDAQEEERHYIGAELHDNVNQILAGTLLNLGMAKSKEIDPSQQVKFIESAMKYITDAIKETRKLSHNLAPSNFEENSLEEMFERLLLSINVDNRFAITLHVDEFNETVIPEDIRINLYRILQEQSKNIIKYAEASAIEITVTLSGNTISLRIFDNGKGFNTKAAKKGIGLSNIKKRADALSGKFILNSAPGKGCEIIVVIPMGK